MALCDTCINYNKEYDEYRQQFDDVIQLNGDKREKHHCLMYDDYIPNKIFHENGKCPYFMSKEPK